MTVSSVVGIKGQVTIEKRIREALGVQPGWRALQRLEGDRVVIEFLPPRHRRSLAGALEHATSVRIPTEAEFQEAVERAWEEAAQEDWNAQTTREEDRGEAKPGDRK
jgi:bifunctional DNA-binding transcriptional regulator/antitoxin component of YhaV-PrlF toxin-antitoxin module